MKKQFNLESVKHKKILFQIVEQALTGITIKEIHDLKKLCKKDRFSYFDQIKMRYIIPLNLLGENFKLTEEIEITLFFIINDVISKLNIEKCDNGYEELTIKLS
ncbi:hypothetical protein [Rossellomorea sp. NRS-1567]|uniref:hypothetical protein n=1 Tax=Rossellomorea sp. NRS-1567 TaxID=3233901 RepID=UPI003D2CCC1A